MHAYSSEMTILRIIKGIARSIGRAFASLWHKRRAPPPTESSHVPSKSPAELAQREAHKAAPLANWDDDGGAKAGEPHATIR